MLGLGAFSDPQMAAGSTGAVLAETGVAAPSTILLSFSLGALLRAQGHLGTDVIA